MAIIVGGLLIALQLVVREIAEDSSAASSGAGVEEHDGFTAIAERPFLKSFANGADRRKAETQFAVQQPDAATLFGERTTAAAWHSKPSWYAVSSRDQTINPDLQRFLAQRMNATTVAVDAGHLSLVSHRREVANQILEAAGQKTHSGS